MVVSEAKKPTSAEAEVSKKRKTSGPPPGTGDPATRGGGFLMTPVPPEIFCRERFSEEQREIERMVREFAVERIGPQREELEVHNEELSRTLLREVGELGLTGIDIPERYGGMELDKTTSAMVVEALTLCGSASWIVTFSATPASARCRSSSSAPRSRRRSTCRSSQAPNGWRLLADRGGAGLGRAEPRRPRRRCPRTAKPTLLNGTKIYVTNGGWADLYTVFAKLDGKKMSAFLVERDSRGPDHRAGGEEAGHQGLVDRQPLPRERSGCRKRTCSGGPATAAPSRSTS